MTTPGTTNGTATFVKQRNAQGEGRVYRVDPPIANYKGDAFDHVWVSAADVPFSGPETYIFGSDADGKVLDWCELDGSFRGGLDHEEALRGAGYEVSA
jgi:hypothetical protein